MPSRSTFGVGPSYVTDIHTNDLEIWANMEKVGDVLYFSTFSFRLFLSSMGVGSWGRPELSN